MSRVGKAPITVPSGVKVSVEGDTVAVEGPKGKMQHRLGAHVTARLENGILLVECGGNSRQARSNHGTNRSIINNMVVGVVDGWKQSLELNGVGFTAQLNGKTLVLATGYSHKTEITIPSEVTCKTEKQKVELESADKRLVGELAAKIRKVCPPEPYLGKGIKYADEVVRRKAGKAGAK